MNSIFKSGAILLIAVAASGQTAQPKAKTPVQPGATPKDEPCKVNYLPYHWTTKPAPTTEAQTKKYGPPPPVEHQGFTIQGMGKCDFTKSAPAPPKGFEKTKVQVKGPNLAFIELPQPNAGVKK